MNLSKLFEAQAILDEKIEREKSLNSKEILPEMFLAFKVELAEMANETRCFKVWSNKPPSDNSIIIEEYADGLHFALSLGNRLGYNDKLKGGLIWSGGSLVDTFNDCYMAFADFEGEPTLGNYENFLASFLYIYKQIGFTWLEVEQAYFEKNKINHERQANGY